MKHKTAKLSSEHQQLYDTLKEKDRLLFELGYNNCDSIQVEELTSEDFESYHDQAGIITSKASFLNALKGSCEKVRRELVEGSLEVFPLYDNGTLYGAIQTGEHRFFPLRPGYLTSTAKFTTLWKKDNDHWKMTRVFSYDHRALEKTN
jgi:hypothetical protein